MIIQSARLRTNCDVEALVRHVFAGPKNEEITVLHGDEDDVGMIRRDAAAAGKVYAIRHFKISPGEAMTRADAARVMRDLAGEFGVDPERCVIVEHTKPRAEGAGYERHWHLLAPEWDPVRRRVLDAHWMRPRQEKIARLAEIRLGHRLVTGRWNAAVTTTLRKEGRLAEAVCVTPLAAQPRPVCAYTGRQHQAAARKGVDLPQARLAVVRAWAQSDNPTAFAAALGEAGLVLRPGDKVGVWLVEHPASTPGAKPVRIGALHRLLRQPLREVAARMGMQDEPAANKPSAPPQADLCDDNNSDNEQQDRRRSQPQPRPRHDTPICHVALIRGDSSADREARRRRWIAQCLRRAYDLDWVPDSVAARIIAVEWRADVEALVITLDTGTRLVDRSERIDVVGRVDDVAIAELVACVQRRGWAAVIVEGSDRFKAAATAALEAAGIHVQQDVARLADIVPSQVPGWR